MTLHIGDRVLHVRRKIEGVITSISSSGEYYRLDGAECGSSVNELQLIETLAQTIKVRNNILIVVSTTGLTTQRLDSITITKSSKDKYLLEPDTLITNVQYEYILERVLSDDTI